MKPHETVITPSVSLVFPEAKSLLFAPTKRVGLSLIQVQAAKKGLNHWADRVTLYQIQVDTSDRNIYRIIIESNCYTRIAGFKNWLQKIQTSLTTLENFQDVPSLPTAWGYNSVVHLLIEAPVPVTAKLPWIFLKILSTGEPCHWVPNVRFPMIGRLHKCAFPSRHFWKSYHISPWLSAHPQLSSASWQKGFFQAADRGCPGKKYWLGLVWFMIFPHLCAKIHQSVRSVCSACAQP